jgi:hypothetical protein
VKAIYAHSERDPYYLGKLTKLHQTDIVEDFITTFEQSLIHIEFAIDCFFK